MAKQTSKQQNQKNSVPELKGNEYDRINEAIKQFKQAYTSGYQLLMQQSKQKASGSNLKMLDSPETFTKFLFDGKPLSEMLGYSDQDIDKFFDAASQLMNDKRFEEAKQAFFFLVTIAPNRSECWLGLGYAYGQCKEPEGALRSYIRVIELSPHRIDGYLAFAHLFSNIKDFARAEQVCDIGLKFANEHKAQPWAADLLSKLKETKLQISQLSSR